MCGCVLEHREGSVGEASWRRPSLPIPHRFLHVHSFVSSFQVVQKGAARESRRRSRYGCLVCSGRTGSAGEDLRRRQKLSGSVARVYRQVTTALPSYTSVPPSLLLLLCVESRFHHCWSFGNCCTHRRRLPPAPPLTTTDHLFLGGSGWFFLITVILVLF